MLKRIKSFLREDEEGSVITLFAVVMLPILILTGLTLETARQIYYETELAYAADAAAIAAARYNLSDVQTNGLKFFWANFNQSSTDISVTPTITLSTDNQYVSVTVSGTVKTILGGLVGISGLKLSASSKVQRAMQNMEVALVLDTTGSMAQNGKMAGLQTAANQLLNTVYEGQNTKTGVAISIVPYVASVNIGTGYKSWLSNPQILTNTSYFPTGTSWAGCVMAVDTKTNMDVDDPPSATRKWPVYQVPTTYQVYGKNVVGDNDWTVKGGVFKVVKASVPTVGPNRSCGLPILGLTNDNAILQNKVNSLAPVDGGGTFGNLGLVWGWNTISPKWKGLWGTGIDPQDYGTVVKSIVIVTDGENNWYDDPNYKPTGDPTAYGRVSDGLLGTTDITKTRPYIDNRLLDLCSKIKNQGIQIFTVTFQVSDSLALQNYQTCATKPEWAFQANNASDLYTNFTNIGALLKTITVVK